MQLNREYLTQLVRMDHCASKDPIRDTICGVMHDGQTLVATDGHKLAMVPWHDIAMQVFWPSRDIQQIEKFLKKNRKQDAFEWSDTTKILHGAELDVVINPIIGFAKYPAYKAIIPSMPQDTVRIALNAEYLLELAESLKADPRANAAIVLVVDKNYANAGPVIVESLDGERSGVIMPVRLPARVLTKGGNQCAI